MNPSQKLEEKPQKICPECDRNVDEDGAAYEFCDYGCSSCDSCGGCYCDEAC